MMKRYDKDKYRQRALKAWKTMKERGYKKKSKNIRFINRKVKEEVRKEITKIIKEFSKKKDNEDDEDNESTEQPIKILTLETSDYLFTKKFTNKYSFFISENNKDEYLKMLENKPENVTLFYGNIIQLASICYDFDVIYLDFCGNYEKEKENIYKLMRKMSTARLIGFTFCLRKNTKQIEDYKFDLINKLQSQIGLNLKVIYGKAYRDGAPMITLFFQNMNKKDYKKFEYEKLFCEDMQDWFLETLHKEFPQIWSPNQILDESAVTHHIKWNQDVWGKMFSLAIKDKKIYLPYLRYYGGEYHNYDIDGVFDYFVEVIQRGLWEKWDRPLYIFLGKEKESRQVSFLQNYSGYQEFPAKSMFYYWENGLIRDMKEIDKCNNPNCKHSKDDIAGVTKFKDKNYCIPCFFEIVNKLSEETKNELFIKRKNLSISKTSISGVE